jgi:membrane-associated phospholipid phosphatase
MLCAQPLTKDLFYSGHFASIFLLFILLKKEIFLFLSIFVGFLLLVQHIHYVYDFLGAVFFSYLSVKIAQTYLSYTWEFTQAEPYQKSAS